MNGEKQTIVCTGQSQLLALYIGGTEQVDSIVSDTVLVSLVSVTS